MPRMSAQLLSLRLNHPRSYRSPSSAISRGSGAPVAAWYSMSAYATPEAPCPMPQSAGSNDPSSVIPHARPDMLCLELVTSRCASSPANSTNVFSPNTLANHKEATRIPANPSTISVPGALDEDLSRNTTLFAREAPRSMRAVFFVSCPTRKVAKAMPARPVCSPRLPSVPPDVSQWLCSRAPLAALRQRASPVRFQTSAKKWQYLRSRSTAIHRRIHGWSSNVRA